MLYAECTFEISYVCSNVCLKFLGICSNPQVYICNILDEILGCTLLNLRHTFYFIVFFEITQYKNLL